MEKGIELTKPQQIIFEVYDKGVQNEDCDLQMYVDKMVKSLSSCTCEMPAKMHGKKMEAELKEILKKDPKAKYRLRYVDYEEGMWTLPLELKDYRIENFANDKSLDKVEVRFSNGNKLVLSA